MTARQLLVLAAGTVVALVAGITIGLAVGAAVARLEASS